MLDIMEFEIMSDGSVFCNGARWSKQDFVRLFGDWLANAPAGEYEIEDLTTN